MSSRRKRNRGAGAGADVGPSTSYKRRLDVSDTSHLSNSGDRAGAGAGQDNPHANAAAPPPPSSLLQAQGAGGGHSGEVRLALSDQERNKKFWEIVHQMEVLDEKSRRLLFMWLLMAIHASLNCHKIDSVLDTLLLAGVLDSRTQEVDYDEWGRLREKDIKPLIPLRDQLWVSGLQSAGDGQNTSISKTAALSYVRNSTWSVPPFSSPLQALSMGNTDKVRVDEITVQVLCAIFNPERLPDSLWSLNPGRWDIGFFELLHIAKKLSELSAGCKGLTPTRSPPGDPDKWFIAAIKNGLKACDDGDLVMTEMVYHKFTREQHHKDQ